MDKQHAVINYNPTTDEHLVKDLGSLNGVRHKHTRQHTLLHHRQHTLLHHRHQPISNRDETLGEETGSAKGRRSQLYSCDRQVIKKHSEEMMKVNKTTTIMIL